MRLFGRSGRLHKLGDTKSVWELLNMINPVNHGRTVQEIETYMVERYVLAEEVY
jgi:cellobiose phosphorylase